MSLVSALGGDGGGEFDRIREIVSALGTAASGIGDDAGLIPHGEGQLVVSTDVSVEGIHFRSTWLSPREIGWRATAAALSDMAAMGASATGVVVAITIPSGSPDDLATECMRGVGDAALAVGAKVIGGDLSGGAVLSLAVTVFGAAAHPVWRNGATPGDELWVTGTLGGSRAGLLALQWGGEVPPGARLAFAHPVPRITAGIWLASQGATAMLDLSDGLAGDAEHLAAASGVALVIDLAALPIHPSVHRMAATVGRSFSEFAAVGGEDYELLVAMPAGWRPTQDPEAWTGVGLTRIGQVEAGEGVRLMQGGEVRALSGFRHV